MPMYAWYAQVCPGMPWYAHVSPTYLPRISWGLDGGPPAEHRATRERGLGLAPMLGLRALTLLGPSSRRHEGLSGLVMSPRPRATILAEVIHGRGRSL